MATTQRVSARPVRRLLGAVATLVALIAGTLIVLPVYLVLLLPAGLVVLAVVRLARAVRRLAPLPAEPAIEPPGRGPL